jgi:hypothetical protein
MTIELCALSSPKRTARLWGSGGYERDRAQATQQEEYVARPCNACQIRLVPNWAVVLVNCPL